jgi:hypothetical protein
MNEKKIFITRPKFNRQVFSLALIFSKHPVQPVVPLAALKPVVPLAPLAAVQPVVPLAAL